MNKRNLCGFPKFHAGQYVRILSRRNILAKIIESTKYDIERWSYCVITIDKNQRIYELEENLKPISKAEADTQIVLEI